MTINKETLKTFRLDFANAVNELERRYNVKIQLGRISFNEYSFTGKIEVNNIDEVSKLKQNQDNNNLLSTYGARFNIGFKFNCDGKTFTVVGFNTRASKKPVELEDEFGRKYKCTMATVNCRVNK